MTQSTLTETKTDGAGLGRPPRLKETLPMLTTEDTSISLPNSSTAQASEGPKTIAVGAKSIAPATSGWASNE